MAYFKGNRSNRKQRFYSLTSLRIHFKGFSLIEVMISLAILSIASMGYIQFEINARRTEYDAALRSQAAILLEDMIDRIRANPTEATKLAGSVYQNANFTVGGALAGASNGNCVGASNASCYSNQIALFDLWEWGQYFNKIFPAGSAANIKVTGNTFTITVSWPNNMGNSTNPSPSNQQLTAQVLPLS